MSTKLESLEIFYWEGNIQPGEMWRHRFRMDIIIDEEVSTHIGSRHKLKSVLNAICEAWDVMPPKIPWKKIINDEERDEPGYGVFKHEFNAERK